MNTEKQLIQSPPHDPNSPHSHPTTIALHTSVQAPTSRTNNVVSSMSNTIAGKNCSDSDATSNTNNNMNSTESINLNTNNGNGSNENSRKVSRPVNILHEMTAGSTASLVARFCIAPLDVLKIRFQIQEQVTKDERQYRSLLQAVRTIYQQEGFCAFWKGNMAAELMVLPYGAVSFLAYQKAKNVLTNASSTDRAHMISLLSGSFSGFCATTATYPLDLLRTRFAAQQEPKLYSSLFHAASLIWKYEGIRGFYVGMWPTLVGIVPLMAIQFGTYETLKTGIKNFKKLKTDSETRLYGYPSLSMLEQSACGFTSGVVSKLLTMPLDVIKKRFQVSGFAWESAQAYQQHLSLVEQSMKHTVAFNPLTPNASISHPHSTSSLLSTGGVHTTSRLSGDVTSSLRSTAAHPHAAVTHATTSASTSTANATSTSPHLSSSTASNTISSSPVSQTASAATSSTTINGNHNGTNGTSTVRPQAYDPRYMRGRKPFKGVIDCAIGIVKHEGIRGLFKGCIPTLLKAGPNSAIIYVVYEQTVCFLRRWSNDEQPAHSNSKHSRI